MTNLDSIFKSRDITLRTKVRLVKAMVFPVVMYGCESWTMKKGESESEVAQSCLTLCDPMNCSMRGLPIHHQLQSLPTFMSTESVMPSNHLILCRPLLLLPTILPSIRVFSSESALRISGQSIRVSASTSVLPMNSQD